MHIVAFILGMVVGVSATLGYAALCLDAARDGVEAQGFDQNGEG